jgi:hypothetical protein
MDLKGVDMSYIPGTDAMMGEYSQSAVTSKPKYYFNSRATRSTW